MKILLLTLDKLEYPSPQIRILEPIRALNGQVQIFNGMHLLQQGATPQQLFAPVDLVIIQRGFPQPNFRPICEAALKSGKPVVYETDDYLQRVPAHHDKPVYNDILAANIDWLARSVDMVTVSTTQLAQVYASVAKQTVVLPNYLSQRLWNDSLTGRPRSDEGCIRLGLVGSKNHDEDFAQVASLLEETLDRYTNVDCVFYGAVPENIATHERISVLPADYRYELHPQRLASLNIDITLAPLTPSKFNRAKSNIKFLEFGFLGIPGLYADLEPYRQSVAHGDTGFLCNATPASWRDALHTLIEQPDLRRQMGARAREGVLAQHLLPQHAHRWLNCYRSVIEAKR